MARPVSLEICLDSVESCIAAERGGAQRVELCADLADDGITPSAGMIAAARAATRIGLHVMIRPRGGDFCYTDAEYEIMKRDVGFAKDLGADGVVFGILTSDGSIDEPRTRELAALSRPMNVTFHRAFDATADAAQSLEILIASGINRLLTSGQAASASQGAGMIRKLVTQSNGRIEIMAGVGITAGNAREIRDATGVRDIHVGSGANAPAREAVPGGLFRTGDRRLVDSEKVARILEILKS
jgi:copper homeostasis protein